ncbi:MAG: tetratricopeptide repeat protein [Planctomycetota bacterium]|nr:tetratricopeptide repeat protein [Planctomycetota bacterium]
MKWLGWLCAVAALTANLGAAETPPAAPGAVQRIPWSKALQERSPHFTIITNTNKELAKQMSQALEQQFADFVRRFAIRNEPKAPLPVKVFAERAEFKKYSAEHGLPDPERVAGYYSPTEKEIVLFWSDDTEDVLNTLYHETTHYFVDLYMPKADAPIWMNEGLAVYFETAQFKNGKLETGQIPYGRLLDLQEALKAHKNHKLSRLLNMDQYGEMGYNLLAYAEGWSLVYFFANYQNGRHAQRFGFYMDELRKGRKPLEAFKNAFQVSPDDIEPIWKDFVLKLKPDGPRAWFEKAQALHYADKGDEAIAACDEALKLDPKFSKALQLKGVQLYFLDKMPAALEALTAAVAFPDAQARTWMYLARTHEDLSRHGNAKGSEPEAEKAYLKAIQLRPDYAEALGLLAWLYATARDPKLNKVKDGIALAQRAVELDPTAEVLDTLAECYHQNKEHEKAIETIKKALALKPTDKEYYLAQLGKFMEAAGKIPPAK